MDVRLGTLPLLLAAWPCIAETGSAELRELVRRGCELRKLNDARLKDYTVLRRVHKQQFDGDGRIKSEEIYTVRTDMVDGRRTSRVVERNDQPLSAEAGAREEKKHRRTMTDGRKPGGKDDIGLDDRFFSELPDALEFKLAGRDRIADRDVLVIDFQPRAGYKAKTIRTRLFEKCQGRVWLDAEDYQVHRVAAELTDDISLGWGLAHIDKGSRYLLEQERTAGGAWVPKKEVVRFGGRFMMMRVANGEVDTSFRVWKRSAALLGAARDGTP